MRRQSNLSVDSEIEKWKIPYLDIIAVGILQFMLSFLALCYGVYLLVFVQKYRYDLKTVLWTVITFVAVFKITNPWTQSYCKHLDNIRHKVHKRNIIITALLLWIDLAVASFINLPVYQIFFYGLLGGFLSSIIHTHLKYSTSETFKSRPQLFDTLDQIMKPFCLIFVPHFILFLTETYGAPYSQLITAGVVLNMIPLTLLIRTPKYQKLPLCKFQTIDRLSIEMSEIHSTKSHIPTESTSSDEDEDDDLLEIIDKPTTPPVDSSTTVQFYYQNVGVKILPNIPEENEFEEEDDINEISSKRLSRISAILQGLNAVKDVNNSVNNLYLPDIDNVNVIEQAPEDETVETGSELDAKHVRCFSISSQTKYNLKVKKREIEDFAEEHFIKSFPRTLGKIYFYPAVISSSITTLLGTVVLASAPCVMLEKSSTRYDPLTLDEAVFLLTIIGFTWIFFLAGYPVFSKLSSIKIKLLFLIGLSISGLSLYVAQKFTYDNFTLFSLSFGLGHGIVSYTERIACEDFFGKRNWKILQGPLEITTGFFVILIYSIIYFLKLEINILLSYGYWPYVFNVSLWILAYISKQAVVYVRKIRRYNRERYPDFDF